MYLVVTLPNRPSTDAEKHWKDVLQGNLLVEHQPKSCTVRLFVSSDPQGIRVLWILSVLILYPCRCCTSDDICMQASMQMSCIEQYTYTIQMQWVQSGIEMLPFPSPSDSVWERCLFDLYVLPRLKHHCESLGLHFHLVNLEPVHKSPQEMIKKRDLSLKEIKLSQQLSIGPSFVVSA